MEDYTRRAARVLVGGVDSTIRAYVKPRPLLPVRGEGAYIYDAEYGRVLDHVLGYGPLILGHRDERVLRAVEEAVEEGWLYGSTCRAEVELAEKITRYVYPGGRVRFVNSGTEATMLALRLARAYTGRDLVVKFDGCYHGAHDYLLVSPGSAAAHAGMPSSPGIPGCVSSMTLIADYNDLGSVEAILEENPDRVAAIIVEPVIGNMGVIPPRRGFLEGLRRLADRYGLLLVFDEVITGFRLDLRGAQGYYGVKADMVVLGKIIGGGFPVGAVVSSPEVMDNLTPVGKVFSAGTFNGHPVTMAAGLATIKILEEEGYKHLEEVSRMLEEAIREELDAAGFEYALNRVGSMQQFFLGVNSVWDAGDARRADRILYERIHEAMLKSRVFIPPSQYETIFTSTAHGEDEVELFRKALRRALRDHT